MNQYLVINSENIRGSPLPAPLLMPPNVSLEAPGEGAPFGGKVVRCEWAEKNAVGNTPAAPHTPHSASLCPYWMLREGRERNVGLRPQNTGDLRQLKAVGWNANDSEFHKTL